jgi:hypothetical protein
VHFGREKRSAKAFQIQRSFAGAGEQVPADSDERNEAKLGITYLRSSDLWSSFSAGDECRHMPRRVPSRCTFLPSFYASSRLSQWSYTPAVLKTAERWCTKFISAVNTLNILFFTLVVIVALAGMLVGVLRYSGHLDMEAGGLR